MAVQVVSGSAANQISFNETTTVGFNTAAAIPASINTAITYANATGGAASVDTVHAKQYTLAATTITIDLFGGTLLSLAGAACVFARVREFAVQIVDTTATHIVKIQSGASSGVLWLPPAANFVWACPGGHFRLSDPNSLTTNGFLVDTTHKNITFDSGAFTIVFNLLIVGNSSAA